LKSKLFEEIDENTLKSELIEYMVYLVYKSSERILSLYYPVLFELIENSNERRSIDLGGRMSGGGRRIIGTGNNMQQLV
jgi:hypothetical protein